jgi:hypothetical protein
MPGAVPMCLKAGQAVFWTGALLHRGNMRHDQERTTLEVSENDHLGRPLYTYTHIMIILPRQARDNDRQSAQKERDGCLCLAVPLGLPAARAAPDGSRWLVRIDKTPFYTKNCWSVYPDRLGTTTGKVEEKRRPFSFFLQVRARGKALAAEGGGARVV